MLKTTQESLIYCRSTQIHTKGIQKQTQGSSHMDWPSASLVFFFLCRVRYFFVTGAPKQSLYSLLKCKLIKVNFSSLKSFQGWVAPMSQPPPPFFIFAACPSSFQYDGLPVMWNCHHLHNWCRVKGANCSSVDVTNAIRDGSAGINWLAALFPSHGLALTFGVAPWLEKWQEV